MITKFKIFETAVKKSEKVDIYRDEKYIVVRPLTHRAAAKLGAYTRWCISHPENEYVWNNEAIVIFIINKFYKPNMELSGELVELNDKIQNGEETEEDEERFHELLSNDDAINYEKIALITTKNQNNIEVWDANNIDISDNYPYDIYKLPVDKIIIDKIYNYLNNL